MYAQRQLMFWFDLLIVKDQKLMVDKGLFKDIKIRIRKVNEDSFVIAKQPEIVFLV